MRYVHGHVGGANLAIGDRIFGSAGGKAPAIPGSVAAKRDGDARNEDGVGEAGEGRSRLQRPQWGVRPDRLTLAYQRWADQARRAGTAGAERQGMDYWVAVEGVHGENRSRGGRRRYGSIDAMQRRLCNVGFKMFFLMFHVLSRESIAKLMRRSATRGAEWCFACQLRAGRGANAETVETALRRVLSLESFAVGDVLADDTSAVVNAIARAAATGQVLDGNGVVSAHRDDLQLPTLTPFGNATPPSDRSCRPGRLAHSASSNEMARCTFEWSTCAPCKTARSRGNAPWQYCRWINCLVSTARRHKFGTAWQLRSVCYRYILSRKSSAAIATGIWMMPTIRFFMPRMVDFSRTLEAAVVFSGRFRGPAGTASTSKRRSVKGRHPVRRKLRRTISGGRVESAAPPARGRSHSTARLRMASWGWRRSTETFLRYDRQ